MATKTELNDLSNELQHIFDKLVEVTKEDRSIMISEGGYNESLGIILDMFEPRLSHFRRKVAKVIENMPRKRRKKSV